MNTGNQDFGEILVTLIEHARYYIINSRTKSRKFELDKLEKEEEDWNLEEGRVEEGNVRTKQTNLITKKLPCTRLPDCAIKI